MSQTVLFDAQTVTGQSNIVSLMPSSTHPLVLDTANHPVLLQPATLTVRVEERQTSAV